MFVFRFAFNNLLTNSCLFKQTKAEIIITAIFKGHNLAYFYQQRIIDPIVFGLWIFPVNVNSIKIMKPNERYC